MTGLVIDNPFRVLNLPTSATERQIQKRIQELLTRAELGKLTDPDDRLPWPALPLTTAIINKAAASLSRSEDRLFHSMMWFQILDDVDETAWKIARDGDLPRAIEVWQQGTAWQHLFNLHSALRGWIESTNGDDLLIDRMVHVLSGAVSTWVANGPNVPGQVQSQLIARLFVAAQEMALEHIKGDRPYLRCSAEDWNRLKALFRDFPAPHNQWAGNRLEQECRSVVEALVHRAEADRKATPTESHLAGWRLQLKSLHPLSLLGTVLGKDSPGYFLLADEVAEEILEVAIAYHNCWFGRPDDEAHPLEEAYSLLMKANELAIGSTIRQRISSSLPVIKEHYLEQQKRFAEARRASPTPRPSTVPTPPRPAPDWSPSRTQNWRFYTGKPEGSLLPPTPVGPPPGPPKPSTQSKTNYPPPPPPQDEPKGLLERQSLANKFIWVASIIALIALASWASRDNSKRTDSWNQSTPSPYSSPGSQNQYSPSVPQQSVPATINPRPSTTEAGLTPSVPPPNGKTWNWSGQNSQAPFLINPGSHHKYCFVRLKSLSGRPVFDVFIHGSQPVKVSVPLGTYQLYWTSGNTWFGTKKRFGPEATIQKAEENLEFRVDRANSRVEGHEITLSSTPYGNMRSRNVTPEAID